MPRQSLLNERWPYLLRVEALCQREGLSPTTAADRVSYRMARGDTKRESVARWLRKQHKANRARLRRQLELGRQQPLIEVVHDLAVVPAELERLAQIWAQSDVARQLRQWSQDFNRAMHELAVKIRELPVEIDVRRAQQAAELEA
jgi:hypothetical protein